MSMFYFSLCFSEIYSTLINNYVVVTLKYACINAQKHTHTHTYLQVKHPSQLLYNFNQNQNVPTNFSTTISKCVQIHSADLKSQHADRQVALIYECTRQNILNYLYF